MFFEQKFTGTLLSVCRRSMNKECEKMVSAVQRRQNYGIWQGLKWEPVFGHGWVERKWMQNFVRQAFQNFWIKHTIFGLPESGEWPKDERHYAETAERLGSVHFDKGIPKLVPQQDMWLNLHGNQVEQQFDTGTNMLQLKRLFKNSLNTFYTHLVLTSRTCYINTLP
jgi:hypothetical protein